MNAQIREAAAEWLVEFRTGAPGIAARRQFAAWLRKSPEHIGAYLDLLALWEEASCYDQARRLDIDALVDLARSDHAVSDIRQLGHPYDAPGSPASEPRVSAASAAPKHIQRHLLTPRTGLAVLLSLAINCGLWWIAIDARNSDYTTQLAEQRSVVLSDGSHIDLNALSKVIVKFSGHERTVELVSGQALFHVTADSRRPFVVRADEAHFRAVGTKFDVNRTSLGTVLTVLEGHVAASVSGAGSGPMGTTVVVDPGQQTTIVHGTISVPQAVDTEAVAGWTRRLLIFNSTPLPVAAEEFNRFNSRRVTIASPALTDVRVTGAFGALDAESLSDFVLYLRRQPGIEVLEQDQLITLQSRTSRNK
jgi:transmembrane sensor